MNKDFQDRIDDYLLGRMSAEDMAAFEEEIGCDDAKKEQFEFTQNVKKAIASRQEKMTMLNKMKMMYDEEHKYVSRATGTDGICSSPAPKLKMLSSNKTKRSIWMWASGIAAIFIIGLLVIKPFDNVYLGSAPDHETIRGVEDEIFDNVKPTKEYHRRGFGCSRTKDFKSNKDIKITEEPNIIDSTALDTIITFGLR